MLFLWEMFLGQLPENYTLAYSELISSRYGVAERLTGNRNAIPASPTLTIVLPLPVSLPIYARNPDLWLQPDYYTTPSKTTTVTLNHICCDSGQTIAILVAWVTKLTNLPRVSRGDQHAVGSILAFSVLIPGETRGKLVSLVTPSTRMAIVWPKSRRISLRVTVVSSTVSCNSPAATTSGCTRKSARILATARQWLMYGSPEWRFCSL